MTDINADVPTLTGQDIGQAERATRAVLDALLAETETSFLQWVTVNVLAGAGSPVERERLVAQLTTGLRIDEPTALPAVDEVITRGLVVGTGEPVRLELTPAGQARYRTIRQGIDQIAQRLYGDLPPEDLATAHRILAIVAERANAELGA
jgi:DNA-binding MarR family transcriptional regulator